MAAKAQRRRAGAGCGGAALIPPRAGNGGNGVPFARRSVGSLCTLTSVYTITSIMNNFNIHDNA
jgi:hypothetical protein